MDKKKVLFIQNTLVGGGAEKILIDILRWFDYERFEVTLLLTYKEGIYFDSIPGEVNVLAMYPTYRSKNYLRVAGRLKKLWHYDLKRQINRVLGDKEFDVIVSFLEGLPVLLHSFILNRAPLNISWVHCDMYEYHITNCFFRNEEQERSIYEQFNQIVFVSNQAKDAFIKLFGIKKNLTVIYNPIKPSEIVEKSKSLRIEKRKFTIINVGRLSPQKNQKLLIEVTHYLIQRGYDIEVWIVGTGELEEELKAQINSLGLHDVVKLWGFQRNPYAYMAAADIFLLTSIAEGYPLVIAEALSLGLPIISTEITGPCEMLNNGVGILTSQEAKDISDAVASLIDDIYLRELYSEKSRLRALDFDAQKIMNNIFNLLNANTLDHKHIAATGE